MKNPLQALRDWNDARCAENLSRRAKNTTLTTRELNGQLLKAVKSGRPRTAEVLLQLGASPDAQLSYAHSWTAYYYPLLTELVRKNDITMASLLIAYKADLSKQDTRTGHTPLHEATIHDRTPLVRLMLDAGADFYVRTGIHSEENVKYLEGVTAREIARKYAWTDVADMLEKEPARREAAAEAAAQARVQALADKKKADEEAAQLAEQQKQEALTSPPKTETGQDIQVKAPLKLKGIGTEKKWRLFG
ncbi:MAG: ankyrin repeat domain-containing protein [Alphaproteobacteria bacterium]